MYISFNLSLSCSFNERLIDLRPSISTSTTSLSNVIKKNKSRLPPFIIPELHSLQDLLKGAMKLMKSVFVELFVNMHKS